MTGPFGFSDPAKRVSDTCRQAIADGHGGQFMAFALDDGRSNATCYLTRADAIRHHGNAAGRPRFSFRCIGSLPRSASMWPTVSCRNPNGC